MKSFFTLTLFTLTFHSFAAAEWKTIAETSNCPEKVQIMAKEGEKFVKLVHGGEEEKLFAQDGSAFTRDTPHKVMFVSPKTEGLVSAKSYSFFRPAMMESTAPKLMINAKGKELRCQMTAK